MSYDKVSLLLPMFGEDNGTAFPDFSPVTKTITVSNLITNTDANSYYGSSASFNGSNRRLQVPHDAGFMFPAGTDFCIEVNAEISATGSRCIVSKWGAGGASTNAWIFYHDGTQLAFDFRSPNGTTYVSSVRANFTPTLNTKYDFCVSREGTTYRLFVDGSIIKTITESTDINQPTTTAVDIGVLLAATPIDWFNGKMNDLRITSGDAVRTAAYTPARMIGSISGTITDDEGDPAVRKVYAVPRAAPTRTFGPVESASDGTYSLHVPITECSRIVLDDDAAPLYNDLIDRVIPA
jgi:hypothetical protein